MFRISLQLFFICTLIAFNRAEDEDSAIFEENQMYNIYRLFREFHSTANFKDQTPFLANHLFNRPVGDLTFDSVLQNSSKCQRDLSYMFESLKNTSNQWALHMLDAFAKPESGILQGNVLWVGEYNECINVHAPSKPNDSTTGDFNGQYCSLSVTINKTFALTFGVCAPDSCSPEDLQAEIMHLLLKAGGFPVLDLPSSPLKFPFSIACRPRERQLNASAISVIVLLSIFSLFALLGSSITAVKYFKKILQEQKQSSLIFNLSNQGNTTLDQNNLSTNNTVSEEGTTENIVSRGLFDSCEPFLTSFCVFTNGAKLLNTDSSEGQLLCIHGIRFFSMSWVVLGHFYAIGFQNIRNKVEFYDVVKDDFFFQAITQAFFSVDSFFVLSGFLLTYLAMKEFSKTKGSMNWVYFYIHRYIRLTPIYMLVLAFYATLSFYIFSGPLAPTTNQDSICKESWWWNLLYINNFNEHSECMPWSWYLANDMQFFIISPLYLITLWRWPKVGFSLLGLSLLVTMLCNFIITYQYDLTVGVVSFMNANNFDFKLAMMKFSDYTMKLYIKSYTRIGPYLIGILLGYLIFRHKTSNWPKLSLIYLCAGWIVASAVTLTTMYGLYHSDLSLVANGFYNALSRICFALGLSWVIYVCLTNQSCIVNNILSYKLFIPLSRLTYTVYLIHPVIILGYFYSLKIPFQFSHPSMVLTFLGLMVVAYGLALPISLILESPVVALEKIIRSKFTKAKQTESNS